MKELRKDNPSNVNPGKNQSIKAIAEEMNGNFPSFEDFLGNTTEKKSEVFTNPN